MSEKAKTAQGEADADEEWKEWEVESNSSDSSGGWQDVPSDGSDIELSDSEDEGKGNNARKKRKIEKARLETMADEAKVVLLDLVEGKMEVAPSSLKAVGFVGFEDDGEDKGSDADTEEDVEDTIEELEIVDESVEVTVAVPEVEVFKRIYNDEDQDEMSLTRANKELEGTTYADLATTKVRSRLPRASRD